MALASESWRTPRPAGRARRTQLRLVPPAAVTRSELLASWRRALDAAADAIESGYEEEAFDAAAVKRSRGSLHAERDWLRTFERETAARFP